MHDKRAYLDANSTTPPAPGVSDAMHEATEQAWHNPGSSHEAGRHARLLLDRARSDLAYLVGADPIELLFTASATESINTAVASSIVTRQPSRTRVITCAAEHSATLAACREWALRLGRLEVVGAPALPDATPDLDALLAAIDERAAVVSLLLANNETGSITELRPVQEACLRYGVPLHIDMTQALGKLPINLRQMAGVSMASFSAHKAHGPKGVGALYLRRGQPFAPLLPGGDQERGRRAGTEAMPAIAGFGAASRWLSHHVEGARVSVHELRAALASGLQALGCDFHPVSAHHTGNTLSVILPPGHMGRTCVAQLSRRGVYCSTGATCSSGRDAPSHVLEAMGVKRELAERTLRLSLSLLTEQSEVEYALQALEAVLA